MRSSGEEKGEKPLPRQITSRGLPNAFAIIVREQLHKLATIGSMLAHRDGLAHRSPHSHRRSGRANEKYPNNKKQLIENGLSDAENDQQQISESRKYPLTSNTQAPSRSLAPAARSVGRLRRASTSCGEESVRERSERHHRAVPLWPARRPTDFANVYCELGFMTTHEPRAKEKKHENRIADEKTTFQRSD